MKMDKSYLHNDITDWVSVYLQCVTSEVRLLVPPDALGGQNQYSDAEDEKDGKPNLSQTRGVFVDAAQLRIERSPTHRGEEDSRSSEHLYREGIQQKINNLENLKCIVLIQNK